MRKYKFFFKSFSKEEEWINNIIEKGYRLKSVNSKIGRYEFIQYTGSPHLISIDYRTFNNSMEYLDYITMFEDGGWNHVNGSQESGIHYFEQTSDVFSKSIFSDVESKAGIYKRLSENYKLSMLTYIPFVIALTIIYGRVSIDALLNWKDYYYTPNIWNMEGWEFIFSFIWETPFAFIRCCGGLLLYVIFIIMLLLYLRSYILYRNEIKKKV